MDQKRYLTVASAIFALVALAHLVRAVMHWPIVIAAALGYFGLTLAKRP